MISTERNLEPIPLEERVAPLEKVKDVIEEYKPKTEAFSRKERLAGIIAVAIPVFIIVTLEAFTGVDKIFDVRLRNLLWVLSVLILVTVMYSVYMFDNPKTLTTVGYLYLFYALFAMLSMVAGRVGFGMAITCSFFMLVFVCLLYRLTKEPLLIISILVVLAWVVGITLIYMGVITEDMIPF